MGITIISDNEKADLFEIDRPAVLYHGSPYNDIKEFEPKVSGGDGEKFGALVYATPDKVTASIFMLKVEGRWCAGKFDETPYVLIAQPRNDFLEKDKGGCIYELPSDSFNTDHNGLLGKYEWASKEKVKPTKKIDYSSALGEVIKNGVQVFFVDRELYDKIYNAEDHGLSILRNLESENKKRESLAAQLL